MSRLRDLHRKWLEDPAYREEYERVQPTTATLRRLARATGTRLKIAFEPAGADD